MKCPVCEDTGKVKPSAPVIIEVEDVTVLFAKWVPCPVCAEGIKAEAEAVAIVRELKKYTD